MLTIGSLFSGIGGLELGLEWAGVGSVVWQCEMDLFCRRVLQKHWPGVTRFEDVRTLRNPPRVDLICGGFPCQGVSSAGARRGLADERSGLWFEYRRIVGEIRPRFVVVENVASGKKLWLSQVKADLQALGYRTRAFALSAADVGAPHLRRRIFVVADTHGEPARTEHAEMGGAPSPVADADQQQLRLQQRRRGGESGRTQAEPKHPGWRSPQPPMVRVVHGVSRGVDGRRRKALGNSVVPQCAEVIGKIIVDMLQGWP